VIPLALGMPGVGEMAVILGVLVLIFGAKKIPQLARGVGSSFFEFKRGIKEGQDALEDLKRPLPEDRHGST